MWNNSFVFPKHVASMRSNWPLFVIYWLKFDKRSWWLTTKKLINEQNLLISLKFFRIQITTKWNMKSIIYILIIVIRSKVFRLIFILIVESCKRIVSDVMNLDLNYVHVIAIITKMGYVWKNWKILLKKFWNFYNFNKYWKLVLGNKTLQRHRILPFICHIWYARPN